MTLPVGGDGGEDLGIADETSAFVGTPRVGGEDLLPQLVLMTAGPRLQARQFHRLSERQGDFRAVVDDTGARVRCFHWSRRPASWQGR
ncbi:hypothetical protein [Streptomyces nigra]|uniref:hypothetical protein n=1 Tax=Streptomyces nigra TaxID=1827580 RepID=UPI0035D80FFB